MRRRTRGARRRPPWYPPSRRAPLRHACRRRRAGVARPPPSQRWARARANSSLGARACSRRGADLRARPQGQPRDNSSRCPSARLRRAPRWLTASMPLTAIGELSSLSMSSGRVATSEASEHKGCLWPARIPRRSQTASLRLNKAQRQRRGACSMHVRVAFCRAPERAPLTGQNDRRAAHVCSGSRATSTVAGVAAHAGRAVAAAACATQIDGLDCGPAGSAPAPRPFSLSQKVFGADASGSL